jgi:hypothetical protein
MTSYQQSVNSRQPQVDHAFGRQMVRSSIENCSNIPVLTGTRRNEPARPRLRSTAATGNLTLDHPRWGRVPRPRCRRRRIKGIEVINRLPVDVRQGLRLQRRAAAPAVPLDSPIEPATTLDGLSSSRPGLVPSSIAASINHRCRHDSETPEVLRDLRDRCPPCRRSSGPRNSRPSRQTGTVQVTLETRCRIVELALDRRVSVAVPVLRDQVDASVWSATAVRPLRPQPHVGEPVPHSGSVRSCWACRGR